MDPTSRNFYQDIKMIKLQKVSFGYDDSMEPIVSDLSVDVGLGESLAVMGPSGSGKTTILRLVAGELDPNDGSIAVQDEVYLAPEILVAQNFRNSIENALLAAQLRDDVDEASLKLAAETLTEVGLGRNLALMPSELSRGMAARLSFVQSLLSGLTVLLFDEPFASLDVKARKICEEVLCDFRRRLELTLVLVTHDFGTAINCADNVLLVSGSTVESLIISKAELVEEVGKDPTALERALFEHYQRFCENLR